MRTKIVAGRFALRCCLMWAIAAGALAVAPRSGVAGDEFQTLVNHVPRSANAIVLLDMEAAKNSPLGIKEDWKHRVENAFQSGLTRVPPQATRYALACQFDFEFMEPIWEAAICDANQQIDTAEIARRRSGTVDKIEGLSAVALPNDTYLVQFGPMTVATMAPANRQLVYRWIRDVRRATPLPLSPYLEKAARFSDTTGSQIIMAVDLDGVLSAERVGKYLRSHPDLWSGDLGELTQLISGVQGVRIGVRVGEQMSGKIVVDLRGDASATAPFAKRLLLQVLSDRGAAIGDFDDWTAQVKGNEIGLAGKLTASGLRRLMSVVEAPPVDELTAGKPAQVSPGDLAAIQAKATLDHFRAVNGMFSDLRQDMRNAKTLASSTLYFDKYAKRIERLPILNVDEELLAYSAFVADQLRQASGSVKTMGIQTNVRQAQTTGSSAYGDNYGYGGYRYGAYGTYGGRAAAMNDIKATGSQRRVVAAEEKAVAATDVQQLRANIIAATTDIRRKMTKKYQIEF